MFTYDNARDFLNSHAWRGSVYGLAAMRALTDVLHHPENAFPVIHVAGTNGKGSTVAALSSILKAAGYRVGRYTSPEVRSYLERFTVDGIPISKETFTYAAAQIKAAYQTLTNNNQPLPTVFEMELAIAWLAAKEASVDVFVMETGMGGRLDATNVIERPLLTIITTIGRDHESFLGRTLPDIAREKGGIIKRGVPLVTWPHSPEVRAVLKNISAEKKSPYIEIVPDDIVLKEVSAKATAFCYKEKPWYFSLAGPHQAVNASGVIEAVQVLRQKGYRIDDEQVASGLENTLWPARFETIAFAPTVILDGAHNPEAVAALMDTLDSVFPHTRRHFICHMFQDKNWQDMLALMANHVDHFYCFSLTHERSLPASQLAQAAMEILSPAAVHQSNTLTDAVGNALDLAQPDDVVVIFGSLSHLEDARRAVALQKGTRL